MTHASPELELLAEADQRARAYTAGIGHRPVFPTPEAVRELAAFDEPVPHHGHTAQSTLQLLDVHGTPGTVEVNGARYFGFVTGATLPVAAAADRMVLAWDNGALGHISSPTAAIIEKVAGQWLLEILDLPRESAVGFTTSATAGTLIAVATARRALLARQGWNLDRQGVFGAPEIKIVVPDLIHVVVKKALRVLGFGSDRLIVLPTDEYGRAQAADLPPFDAHTVLILQAGEVNTGEFDPFADIIPIATAAGSWVHVDGAFGLWARASKHRDLTAGIELADSWTVDGHKWLNTPYDSAMVIVRDRDALAETMVSDAAYTNAAPDAQRNLTLEFSRRARGIAVWAALRTLGRDGLADLVERTMGMATQLAEGLQRNGFTVLNRVVLNQIIARTDTPEDTARILAAVQGSGRTWFGSSIWKGQPVFRFSVTSWRTEPRHIDELLTILSALR